MAINIGPKIGIDGEKAFRDEIQKIGQQLKVLDSEMKIVTNSFKNNGDEQAGLIDKSDVLTKQIEVQKKGIEELKKGLDASTEAYGENDINTLKWQKTLNDAVADLKRMDNELTDTAFELKAMEWEAAAAADATGDMEKATEKAGDAAEETGSRFGGPRYGAENRCRSGRRHGCKCGRRHRETGQRRRILLFRVRAKHGRRGSRVRRIRIGNSEDRRRSL